MPPLNFPSAFEPDGARHPAALQATLVDADALQVVAEADPWPMGKVSSQMMSIPSSARMSFPSSDVCTQNV